MTRNNERILAHVSAVAEQASRLADLAHASNPSTPLHVIDESARSLAEDVAALRADLLRLAKQS
jgi:hypothetical protein